MRSLHLRNRRILIMLILLTASFALSTLPSSIYFSFFRPILRNKPYRRLFTLMSNLTKHLSHTFNFIIYFKYSSMIKQELNEIINTKIRRFFLTKSSFPFCERIFCYTHNIKKKIDTNCMKNPIKVDHLTNQENSSNGTKPKKSMKISTSDQMILRSNKLDKRCSARVRSLSETCYSY
jgi:hypothetical protein